MFLRNKIRNVSIFAVLFVMLAFSAALATNDDHVILILKAPEGVNLSNITLNLYPGTGSTGPIAPTSKSDAQYEYRLNDPGTYNYRVTGTDTYYGTTKLLHFTSQDVNNEVQYVKVVLTGRRPTDNLLKADPVTVNRFTDQIEERMFGITGGDYPLVGFPAGGLNTPVFTKPKGLLQGTMPEEYMEFILNLQAKHPNRLRAFVLGKSPAYGYQIPVVILSRAVQNFPANITFEQAAKIIRENDRATFFYQAMIDAEETSAGEGAMQMLYEMLETPYGEQWLDRVDFVTYPLINPDGVARFIDNSISPDIDLNRDHLRLITDEIRFLHYAYLQLMPEVVMDGHEMGYYTVNATNSPTVEAFATRGLTDIESTPATSMLNPSKELNHHALHVFGKAVFDRAKAGGFRIDHYQNGGQISTTTNNGWTMDGGFTCNHSIGRAYFGLMGSVSFLVELRGDTSHQLARRTWGQVTVAKALLETLHANHEQTKKIVRDARANAVKMGKVFEPNPNVKDHTWIPLHQYPTGRTQNFMSTGVEEPGSLYSPYKSIRLQSDMLGNIKKFPGTSTFFEMVEKPLAINDASYRWRTRPTAYIVPKGGKVLSKAQSYIGSDLVDATNGYSINYDYLLTMLKANGIEYYETAPGQTVPLRQYYRADSGNSTAGAVTRAVHPGNIEADLRDEVSVSLVNGAYVIPLDQEAGAVAIALFEPDITNSNGYNASVAQSAGDWGYDQGLVIITHDPATRNYPYYRLEKDNPRVVFNIPEKGDDCKDKIKDKIDDILNEIGCNAGLSVFAIALIAIILAPIRRFTK